MSSLVEIMPRKLPAYNTDGSKGATLTPLCRSGELPDHLVLRLPNDVQKLHEDFASARADIIQTCSFGSNRFILQKTNPGITSQEVIDLNRSAAELAKRAVSGTVVFVAGSMGPIGEHVKPVGKVEIIDAIAAFSDQAFGLLTGKKGGLGGVDILNIETFSYEPEVYAAILGALTAMQRARRNVPLVVTMSFNKFKPVTADTLPNHKAGFYTSDGVSPAELVRLTNGFNEIYAVGANCGLGYDNIGILIRSLVAAKPNASIWIKPNAGLPRAVPGGETVYDQGTVENAATFAVEAYQKGAEFIGGCCGTKPKLIEAMVQALQADQTYKVLLHNMR